MRLRLFVADEYKPLRLVPWPLWLLTISALFGQIAFHHFLVPTPTFKQTDFQTPPSSLSLQAAAFGEPASLARILVLRIQSFDNQPGVSVPFKELNYETLGDWLTRIVYLDPHAEYPHFLMSKIYSSVSDAARRRETAKWVYKHFLDDPVGRWEWMAHVTNMVRYVLKDNVWSLELAKSVRDNTKPGDIPNWARQMEIFFLENQNEYEAAVTMLENELSAGNVSEPQEFAFLSERLEGMLQGMFERNELSQKDLLEKINKLDKLTAQFLEQHDVE